MAAEPQTAAALVWQTPGEMVPGGRALTEFSCWREKWQEN